METWGIYTAIYGGHDALRPLPANAVGTCYTDDPNMEAAGWDVQVVPMRHIPHGRMQAKFWKVHPHIAVPNVDVSIWMDGSMTLGPDWGEVGALIKDCEALFFRHPDRDSILEEANVSRIARREANEGLPLEEQVAWYLKSGRWKDRGLFASGAMVRRACDATREMSRIWWEEQCRWSDQDQLSMPLAVAESEIRWDPFPGLLWTQSWFALGDHLRYDA